MSTEPEWWGVAEAASHCRLAASTWRDHVSRGTAPAPQDVKLEGGRWRPKWRAATVRDWNTNGRRKPGRPRKQTDRDGDRE